MEVIHLTAAVHAALITHARAALPAEAVGILGGPAADYATHSLPLPNRLGQQAFWADPFAQFQAERQLAHLGLHFVAVYHSHPGGGVQLSSLDRLFAHKRACLQLVIALARPHRPGEEVRAYRVADNGVVAIAVQVGGRL